MSKNLDSCAEYIVVSVIAAILSVVLFLLLVLVADICAVILR